DKFTYITPPAPTVTGLSVTSGYTVLSSTVLVNGANYLAVSRVTLNGVTVPFSRLSDTQLRLTLPVHTAGVFDIQVTTPGGTSAAGAADRFTYVTPSTPTITGLSVTSGAATASTTVLVNGTGFVKVSRVTVGGVAIGFTQVSDTQLKVTLPRHATGVVDIQVTAAGGTSALSSADRFTYAASASAFGAWPTRVLHWLGF
ncbi:IPTL-CTERM sorting domain-containing protein, partial [Planosporangium thailandense]